MREDEEEAEEEANAADAAAFADAAPTLDLTGTSEYDSLRHELGGAVADEGAVEADDDGNNINGENQSLPPITQLMCLIKDFVAGVGAPRVRIEHDYYIPSFLVEFVSFIVICFGWEGFRAKDQYQTSAAESLSTNNIPWGQLLYMLMQFLLIVIDRAIYLRRHMKAKIVFYIVHVLLLHVLVFYWIPISTRRSPSDNTVIIILYLLKVRRESTVTHTVPNQFFFAFLLFKGGVLFAIGRANLRGLPRDGTTQRADTAHHCGRQHHFQHLQGGSRKRACKCLLAPLSYFPPSQLGYSFSV